MYCFYSYICLHIITSTYTQGHLSMYFNGNLFICIKYLSTIIVEIDNAVSVYVTQMASLVLFIIVYGCGSVYGVLLLFSRSMT